MKVLETLIKIIDTGLQTGQSTMLDLKSKLDENEGDELVFKVPGSLNAVAIEVWASLLHIDNKKLKGPGLHVCTIYNYEYDVARILIAQFNKKGFIHGKNVILLQIYRNKHNMHSN